MNAQGGDKRFEVRYIALIFALFCLVPGCGGQDRNRAQGYIEGEYVYIAAPLSGALIELNVRRGSQVSAGEPLFTLDSLPEKASRDEIERKFAQARAKFDDARKGKRPSEIESIKAQIRQARAALDLSEKELSRQERMLRSGSTSVQDSDRARSTRDQNRHRVAQLEADIRTARLGQRSDQIAAADANLKSLSAALSKAEWDLSQKRQTAPQTGLVFDTFYNKGEWVPAGRPVVALLPPENIKVRAFVPESSLGTISLGSAVKVFVDGINGPFVGSVSYISPRAEYTPPVIYSKESRHKLVYMIEAVFDPEIAAKLHPGQPVDVGF
jgi:HlyD family secretion protein